MKRIWMGLTALAVLSVVAQPAAQDPAAPQATAPAPAPSKIIQRVLVKVNGEIFTQRDLQTRLIEALQDQNRDVRRTSELENPAIAPLVLQLTPQVLLEAINDLIMIQRARELGFKMSDAQYKDALEGLKKTNKIDDAQLKTALAQQGMTMEQLRQKIEFTSLMQQLERDEIMSRTSTTEEEARQYYEKHPEEFVAPATITLREIVATTAAGPVSSSGLAFGSAGTSETAARAKIEAARERVLKGEDFAKVASDVSESASKANGGLMPPIVTEDLAEALKTATAGLKVGEVTEVIKTGRGFQIFKIEARGNKGVQPLEKVHQAIFQKLYDQKRDGERKKYVDRLRGTAIIEWKDESLKKLFDTYVTSGK